MPDGFTKITQEQAESCPDGDGAVKALETALQSIGVKKVSDCYWGNYKTAGSVVDMEAYLITDAQNLIVRCQYLNNNWTVVISLTARTDICIILQPVRMRITTQQGN